MTPHVDGVRHSPAPSDGPIYIVGLDRSGKTTMRAFLASHSRIAIPAVGSNMWTYFYRRFGRLDDPANLTRCLDQMARYKHVRYLEPDLPRIRAEFESGPATYARLFSLFLAHHAEREGKARWGAQSGLVEQYAEEMFDAYPGLKVVHLVRDPRDRYEASLAKWPEGRGRAGGAAARWRYSLRWAERNQRRHPDAYLVVRFEDLVTSTETTLRRVCDFLGEPYEPGMLTMTAAPEFRSGLGEDHHATLLSAEYLGRYRGLVPDGELAFMQLHLGGMMRRHGYMPDPVVMGPRRRFEFAVTEWPSNAMRALAWTAAETAHRRWPQRLGHQPGRRMLVDPDPAEGTDSAVSPTGGNADGSTVTGT
jgi:hypothetical protein